jgi:predicted enzyme related to lactoylglutathione lyase
MDPVVHFEMPYEDGKRMAKFYEAVFGWETQMLGEDMGRYVLATTTETGKAGPKKRGRINGGFYPKKPDWPAQYPSVVIAVNNVKVSMKRVIKQGGKVLGEPMEIPGVGKYVSIIDTEGNRVSLLQPIPQNWHAPKKK